VRRMWRHGGHGYLREPGPRGRALAAWRAANPDGLIGRLVALHQKNTQLAYTLARYAGQYYGLDGELTADVAAWPVPAQEVK